MHPDDERKYAQMAAMNRVAAHIQARLDIQTERAMRIIESVEPELGFSGSAEALASAAVSIAKSKEAAKHDPPRSHHASGGTKSPRRKQPKSKKRSARKARRHNRRK